MADAGNAITGRLAPTGISTCTNIPGRSLPSGFASVACTCTLRVFSSTTESIAVTCQRILYPSGPRY